MENRKFLEEYLVMFRDLVLKNRSYRRFYENERVSPQVLRDLVDLARLSPSAANVQALKFRLVYSPAETDRLFPCLYWAAALPEWGGPAPGERPAAYIIVLCDLQLGKNRMWDDGIAAQTIMLGAVEKGLGGCMLGALEREKIAELFTVDTDRYSIDLVLALGRPKEIVKIVPVSENGSIAYYRDAEQVHYVPKRSLDELVIR